MEASFHFTLASQSKQIKDINSTLQRKPGAQAEYPQAVFRRILRRVDQVLYIGRHGKLLGDLQAVIHLEGVLVIQARTKAVLVGPAPVGRDTELVASANGVIAEAGTHGTLQ